MFDFEKFNLRLGDLILIDSAPIMYLIEAGDAAKGKDADRAAVVRLFAEAAYTKEIRLAASAATWTECLAGPLRAADEPRAAAYRRFLSDSSRIVLEPVGAAIAEEAARLLSLPSPPQFADALHIATGAAVSASAVLTNDEQWRRILAEAEKSAPARIRSAYRSMRLLLVDELVFDL